MKCKSVYSQQIMLNIIPILKKYQKLFTLYTGETKLRTIIL